MTPDGFQRDAAVGRVVATLCLFSADFLACLADELEAKIERNASPSVEVEPVLRFCPEGGTA